VPDELLRLHEEGEVVFFCGAGISMGAGLPDFKGLVRRAWKEVGYNPSSEEKRLNRDGRCDVALELLGNKLDDAITMRNGVAAVLSRYRDKNRYNRVHKALLALSQTRDEVPRLHLVTTNFDRLFENVRQDLDCGSNSYIAPLIPVPKKFNWDGIVYLHGLLPDCPDEASLKNLVMTSGDFGRAYLTERWAARFVSELFRNFVVCFVGYSLADPVMRYIADAINADNAEGEETKPIYMFIAGDGSEGLNRNKSIKLIRYSSENGHAALNKTLEAWANTYSSGANGKEAIIDANADIDPDKVVDNGYVGRMIWALSDKDGVGARRFASHDPVPPINWAKVLMSERGIVPVVKRKNETHLLWLSVFDSQYDFDVRRGYIWNWMLRHLSSPELVWIVLREGDVIHPEFKRRLSSLLTSSLSGDVANKRGVALNQTMYRLWRLISAGKVISGESRCLSGANWYCTLELLKKEPLNYSLLQELRELLTPVIYLEKQWHLQVQQDDNNDAEDSPYSYFKWGFRLRCECGSAEYHLKEIRRALKGKLAEAFDSIEAALIDGLESLYYLDANAESSGVITYDILSIEEHTQNKHSLRPWRGVVDLLRDAWLELANKDRARAFGVFRRWIASKHFLLQRLALFSAKCSDVVIPHEWYESLIANHGFLLWMTAAKREVLRLLDTTAKNLIKDDFDALADIIASGPPPCMFISLDRKKAGEFIDRRIWLRLKKMECSEHEFPKKAKDKFKELTERYPKWHLLRNQQEEFLFWSYGTGDPDFEAETQHVLVPETLPEMVAWLSDDIGKPEHLFNEEDNWTQVCKDKPMLALNGLESLARENKWNGQRINEAISVWREVSLMGYGRQFLERNALSCPDSIFRELANTIALWCEEAVKKQSIDGELVVQIAKRISSMTYEYDTHERNNTTDSDPVFDAINHPVGRILEALLDSCFGETIHKGDGIPDSYKEMFSFICSTPGLGLRHGRVILVSRIVGLYYADENWVRENLYPLLDWNHDAFEARAAWNGFLWVGRPYPPLMVEVKQDFLCTAKHIDELGNMAERYCSFLTLMGLWHVPGYNRTDYKKVFGTFPAMALAHCANTLARYQTSWFDSDADKRDARMSPERLWTKEVRPFIHDFWPKDAQKISKEIRRCFLQLVIGTGKEFPNALQSLEWILKGCDEEDDWHLHLMKEHTKCLQEYPDESLEYLSEVSQNINWDVDTLKECLDEIAKVRPDLENDGRYLQLRDLIRKRKNML